MKRLLLLVGVAFVAAGVPRARPAKWFDERVTLVCNGSGVNPVILSETVPPKVVGPWVVQLDCTAATAGKPAIFRISIVDKPPPLLTKWGEILVSLSAGTGFHRVGPPVGSGIHPLTTLIPDDASLVGRVLRVQGLCGDEPIGFLSNALESPVRPATE